MRKRSSFLHPRRLQLHQRASAASLSWTTPICLSWQRRCFSSPVAPPPPPPTAPPHPLTPHTTEATPGAAPAAFADIFQHEFLEASGTSVQEAALTTLSRGVNPAIFTPQLSPWLLYLAGLRRAPPATAGQRDGVAHANRNDEEAAALSPRLPHASPSPSHDPDPVFLHHVFDNAKEATLYVTVRRPHEFLRPDTDSNDVVEALSTCAASSAVPAHAYLIPISVAFAEMETALRDMATYEKKKNPASEAAANQSSVHSSTIGEDFLLPFWRAMLEQAFLRQYCDLDSIQNAGSTSSTFSTASPSRRFQSLYPYNYAKQPRELRRRVERGLRTLLCASAFTLHAQWEQFIARHGPSDIVAQVLGLELVLLWWYANPDQLPFELAPAVNRLPPPTLRQAQYREAQQHRGVTADRKAALPSLSSLQAPSVEHHLYAYAQEKFGLIAATQHTESRPPAAVGEAGGFLCPAAVFPPSYIEALRSHVATVRHKKDLITCPLFIRVLDVTVAVAASRAPVETTAQEDGTSPARVSSSKSSQQHPAAEPTTKMPQQRSGEASVAGMRAREVAEQLVHQWLWPVVCQGCRAAAVSETARDERNGVSTQVANASTLADAVPTFNSSIAMEKPEDWAVLLAAVTAVAHIRSQLLLLRRTEGEGHYTNNSSSVPTTVTAEDRRGLRTPANSIAHVRDVLYARVMASLLPHDEGERDAEGAAARPPDWVYHVFAHVCTCFQESGWLLRDVARQPATPTRLWHLLFHRICDVFPHVFHADSTVAVLWTLYALEGVASAPSLYFSTYRHVNKGKVEAMLAWAQAMKQPSEGIHFLEDGVTNKVERRHETPSRTTWNASELPPSLWSPAGDDRFCPTAERRQQATYVCTSASTEGDVLPRASPTVTAASPSSLAPRAPRQRDTALPFSIASPCLPAPPLNRTSESRVVDAQAHWLSCEELSDEVTSTLIQLFRRYATLPILQYPDVHCTFSTSAEAASPLSAAEPTRLRRAGKPSLLVLLQLVRALAMFGDTYASPGGTNGNGNSATSTPSEVAAPDGLIPAVMQDILPSCPSAVATYLRKLQVYCATVSGRDGALALLFQEAMQEQLNRLPPALGRRRLLAALLWSGLPASALAKERGEEADFEDASGRRTEKQRDDGISGGGTHGGKEERATFGSGSLAWHVLKHSQTHFFSFQAPTASAATAVAAAVTTPSPSRAGDDEDAGDQTDPPTSNRLGDVTGLVAEVLRHLWQLAITIPDSTRVPIHLQPWVTAAGTGSDSVAADARTDGNDQESEGAASIDGGDVQPLNPHCCEGEAEHFEESRADYNMGEEVSPPTNRMLIDHVENLDAAAGWTNTTAHVDDYEEEASDPPFSDDLATYADGDAVEEDASSTPRSTAAGSVRPAPSPASQNAQAGDVVEADEALNLEHRNLKGATSSAATMSRDYSAFDAVLRPSLPAAQHLFSSLLEVLAWTTNPQSSAPQTGELMAYTPLNSEGQDSHGRLLWCAELAANYRICAAVWAKRAGVTTSTFRDTSDTFNSASGEAVLCRPKLMTQILLLLLQTCPDVYLVSLLLLNLISSANETSVASPAAKKFTLQRLRRAGFLLPWTVDCALAQVLYHAGVTSAKVQRWRATAETPARPKAQNSFAETTYLRVLRHYTLLMSSMQEQEDTDSVSESIGQLRTASDALLAEGESRATSTSTALPEAVEHDLMMSIGSLLLSCLELRERASTNAHSLYRYNFYINEFLLHHHPQLPLLGAPSATRDLTALRVILPSLQLTTPSTTTTPPQQLVPLRHAWRCGMSEEARQALRDGFSGHARQPTKKAAHNHGLEKNAVEKRVQPMPVDADDYVSAFL